MKRVARIVAILVGAVFWAQHAAAEPKAVTSADLALVNRVGFGLDRATLDDLRSIGAEAWLHRQLKEPPNDNLPPDVSAMIDALSSARSAAAEKVEAYLRQQTAPRSAPPASADAIIPRREFDESRTQLVQGAQMRRVLREIYGRDQLREQMAWFWYNHFNVHVYKSYIALLLPDYEDQVLRPHALGRFRDLVEADLRHPAMLKYLDNAENGVGHLNENYARELLELHTMGVGSGYTQQDVEALAKILTGVTINPPYRPTAIKPDPRAIQDGDFVFDPSKHDFSDKILLGHRIAGSGYDEVRQALDIICREPATARFVSTKLARFFVADAPPQSLVRAMAAEFTRTDGDIASVLDLLFHAPEFRSALQRPLLKDPEHYIVSAMRIAYGDRTVLNAKPIVAWIAQMGEPVYGRVTPDGYPTARGYWNGPGQIEQRFEIAKRIGFGAVGLFQPDGATAPVEAPLSHLQEMLAQTPWPTTLSPTTKATLAQANSVGEWNTLLLSSPEFMGR